MENQHSSLGVPRFIVKINETNRREELEWGRQMVVLALGELLGSILGGISLHQSHLVEACSFCFLSFNFVNSVCIINEHGNYYLANAVFSYIVQSEAWCV